MAQTTDGQRNLRSKISMLSSVFIAVNVIGLVINATSIYACQFDQPFENAIADSDAIFLGTAIEERIIPLSTKGGAEIGYSEVKFEVENSWKLIDKKFVWLRIPARRADECGFGTIGSTYLVYANRVNDLHYISPMSRTMPVNEADNDIQKLGPNKLHIYDGEFQLFGFTLGLIFSFVAVFSVLFCCFIWVIRRRSVSLFSVITSVNIKFFFLFIIGICCSCSVNKSANQIKFALACVKGDLTEVEKLVKTGNIEINAVNGTIGPCLVSASYVGNKELTEFLINHGADVNVRDEKGGTAVVNAVIGNKPEVVKLLLYRGADANLIVPDENGRLTDITALRIAKIKGNLEIIKLLEDTKSLQEQRSK